MGNPTSHDPEKGADAVGRESGDRHRKMSLTGRKSSMAESVIAAELLDERYRTTQRGLKSRHAQMIALGGTIGTGLFVGSGQTLATGGPAFILASYLIMTFLVYCVVTAMTEVATYMPIHGGTMSYYGYRYVSRSLGFALGYLYWYALGILVPYEITAAGLVINYWPNDINIAVWITIMLVVIVALNFLPVKYYGETEFWFAGTKVILMVGLLILAFILFWGGGPSHDRLGFRYWNHPGAANTLMVGGDTGRFVAFWETLVLSVFPFTFAPELLVVTGGEMESPRRNLPIAAKRYFYRLVIFYCLSVLAIGVICPSNDPRLTDGGAGAGSSPFVVAIANAGIPALPSIINAVIIVSAWSSGNSFLYISSRALYSLAVQGSAPRVFKRCNKWGVPYAAVACSSLFSALAYLNVASSGSKVFNWFMNLTNTWGMMSWICCMIIYFRFRKAIKAQGIESPYHNRLQPYGAWIALVMFTLLCLINGFTVFWPSEWSASSFLTAYVGIPIFFVMYFGHRIVFWHDKWAWDPAEIDMTTGMQEVMDAEKPVKQRKGFIGKLLMIIE
jgi:amino acid transporter